MKPHIKEATTVAVVTHLAMTFDVPDVGFKTTEAWLLKHPGVISATADKTGYTVTHTPDCDMKAIWKAIYATFKK